MQTATSFNLTEWRDRLKLSASQLAAILNVAPSTIVRIEQKGTATRMLAYALIGIAYSHYRLEAGAFIPAPDLEALKARTDKRRKKKYFLNGVELGFNPFKGN